MKRTFTLFAFSLFTFLSFSQQEAKWLRYPAISPDGSTVVFTYQGDLYRVAAEGGLAFNIPDLS